MLCHHNHNVNVLLHLPSASLCAGGVRLLAILRTKVLFPLSALDMAPWVHEEARSLQRGAMTYDLFAAGHPRPDAGDVAFRNRSTS